MSNYRRNGPSAEYRPREDSWAARRDQYREPPIRSNSTWDSPSGETSRDGRRNDFSQPAPRNRSEHPSSGQYVPLSRRTQVDSDRRADLRPDSDSRSGSAYAAAASRRPPTAPRDHRADVERSRWRESRYEDAGASASGFEHSRHRDDILESSTRNGHSRPRDDSPTDPGLNGDGRKERTDYARTDMAEPPRKRSRRSPSYDAYERRASDSRNPKSFNGDRSLPRVIDHDRTSVSGSRRTSIRDDGVSEPSRYHAEERLKGSSHRDYDDPVGKDRRGGADFLSRREGSHRTTSKQENTGYEGRSSNPTRQRPHATTSRREFSPSRTSHRQRNPSPVRSRRNPEETTAQSSRSEAQERSSRSVNETRRSITHTKRERQRGRSPSFSSSDSEWTRSHRGRRYSRSSSSSSDAYRKRRRARSPGSSSPDSSHRDIRKRKYSRSPSIDHARKSPRRRSRSPMPSNNTPSAPQSRISHVPFGTAPRGVQGVRALSQTRTAAIKIALPHAEVRQVPTGPASTRNRPGPTQMPQRNTQPDFTSDRQTLRRDTSSGLADPSFTVSQGDSEPVGEYAELANSLQLQHSIYADLKASAGPEVRNVLSALLQSKTGLTADVEQFWIKTMRRQPSSEQLQMLRVLQGQCMVIADLEKQMGRLSKIGSGPEIDQSGHHREMPSTGWDSNSSNMIGQQYPREVPQNQDQARHHLAPEGLKENSQGNPLSREGDPGSGGLARQTPLEVRRPEDIAQAMKPKRLKETKPSLPYEKLAQVGEGTYGKVYKARNGEGVGLVALKRIRMEGEKDGFPVTAMREIKLLQGLDHVNVVKLHEMMISNGSVHMVMEYMDHDLSGILSQPQISLSVANLKSFCQQMLRGLAYLHRKAILHRDMKGSNILINSKGELKLADFGLARYYTKRKQNDYTNRVVTLWYRSPELLLGETMYDVCIDNWSAGCIMLELFVRKPVFQGNDEIHQLEAIYEIMGTPTEEEWPGLASMPWYELVKPKEVLPSRFDEFFGRRLNTAGAELAKGLLHYDPAKRLTADQALDSSFFSTEEPAPETPLHIADIVGEWHEMEAKHERARRKQRET